MNKGSLFCEQTAEAFRDHVEENSHLMRFAFYLTYSKDPDNESSFHIHGRITGWVRNWMLENSGEI